MGRDDTDKIARRRLGSGKQHEAAAAQRAIIERLTEDEDLALVHVSREGAIVVEYELSPQDQARLSLGSGGALRAAANS